MAKHPFSEVLGELLPLKEEVCARILATQDLQFLVVDVS